MKSQNNFMELFGGVVFWKQESIKQLWKKRFKQNNTRHYLHQYAFGRNYFVFSCIVKVFFNYGTFIASHNASIGFYDHDNACTTLEKYQSSWQVNNNNQ